MYHPLDKHRQGERLSHLRARMRRESASFLPNPSVGCPTLVPLSWYGTCALRGVLRARPLHLRPLALLFRTANTPHPGTNAPKDVLP